MLGRVDFDATVSGALVRRAWTAAERTGVVRASSAQFAVAVEPLLCALVFTALTAGMLIAPGTANRTLTLGDTALVFAPLFGIGGAAFGLYAMFLLVAPLRALGRTFRPIYCIDGYVRYRGPDRNSRGDAGGYVAVLGHDRRTIAEWPVTWDGAMSERLQPALVEFCFTHGIHRIDGRPAAQTFERSAQLAEC